MNEWRPPTTAELKVIEKRRERNDKISALLGSYMLRGYKMLGDYNSISRVSDGPQPIACSDSSSSIRPDSISSFKRELSNQEIFNFSSKVKPAISATRFYSKVGR